ncbi:uncharacterized protein [Primulina huaijiensis]|uniref:uncharacterized protein isoform X1 n=2 Tax=Primulina huaijiensis TaxID=1492673 RepID=UPI003CC74C4E
MPESDRNPKRKSLITSGLVSIISVFVTQLTLFLLPQFLPTLSLLTLLPLSALLIVVVMGLGRCCKKVLGVRASAPAFVFFSIIFIWAVYIYVVRQVISPVMDIVFNIEIVTVVIGLLGIMSVDPGFVKDQSCCLNTVVKSYPNEVQEDGGVVQQESLTEESFTALRRVRYCRHCDNYIMGFDHHCPAFGNCIGKKNHFFFIVLLVGIVASEASYFACASQYTTKSLSSTKVGREQSTASRNLVLGTMLFSLIQVVWQVVFIAWHVYCACFNIKTDEWINWEKYPEFHVEVIPCSGVTQTVREFKNPYDKGIVNNLKDFIAGK